MAATRYKRGQPIRAALARPCVAADDRASGRTLRACCPLGAPLGGCSTSRRAAPCPRCSRGTLPKGTPVCGSRTARPANHPTIACWRLAALPARATSGGGLSACAWGCRWHSLRNNARASRADGAAAKPPLHYRAAGALSRPRAHKPYRAARPPPLAAYRWPHLGGARPPGPVTGLGRLARPGLYNGPYSGARALSGPRAHSRAPGGGHCSQRWARCRGLIIWGRCPQPPGAAAPQARAPPYLDTLVTTHVIILGCKIAKNGITKAPVTC